MATVLGLALKISADASGLPKSLTPVERALNTLGDMASKSSKLFDQFVSSTSGAGKAQQQLATDVAFLTSALKTKQISAKQFTEEFAKLQESATKTAEAFAEGARLTERNRTEEEKRASAIARLDELFELGAIGQRAYNAEMMEATGLNAQMAAAEQERAELSARATSIIEANLTAQERAQNRYDQEIAEYNRLRAAGLLGEEDFAKAVQRSADSFAKATVAAGKYGNEVKDAGKAGTLQFNELSGILAALPGPLGNIAGRLSGLSSAAEGLGRIFSGGLSSGISGVASSFAGLVTPVTAGLAAVAGFGAAAARITRGLTDLEDRVEKLGNVADKLGVSFGFVQVLDEAARRSGTSIDAVSAAFGRLQKNVLGVDEESKAAQAALKAIGVAAEELQALAPEEQYRLIGESLKKIEDPARRTAAATALFGKSGADLLPFFKGITGAAADLERVGAALSNSQRRDIDDFGNAMDRLSVAAKGAGEQIYASFAGAGTAIANALSEATGAVAKFVEEQNKAVKYTDEVTKLRKAWESVSSGPITDAAFAALRAGQTAEQVLKMARGEAVELKEAIEEPPSDGFLKSLDDINKKIEAAKLQSVEFGQAGFDAAVQYEEAIADLKEKLAAGLFNEETFRREAAKAGEAYRVEVGRLQGQGVFDLQESEATNRAVENLRERIAAVVEGTQQFGQAGFDAAAQFQGKLRELGQQFEDGRINATTLADETARATAEYQKQIDGLTQIADLQKSILEAERARVDELLKQGDTTTQLEKDIDTVLREQLRLEEEIRKQREAGNVFAADAAAARLAQLDQLQAKLEEQQQALDQGFGEGFAKAFDATNKSIGDLINKAAQFGNVGAQAAQQLQAGIARAQEQARAGILTQETFQKEVEKQKAIFDERLAAAQRVEDFLRSKLDERQKAEFDAVAKLEERKKQAVKNVEALEAKIAETKKQNEAARESGDLRAAKASADRLRDLQQAQRAEKQLADNRAGGQQQQFRRQIDTSLGDFQSFITRSNDMFLKSIQDTYAGANAALAQAAQTYAELERRRQETLRPDTRAVQVADIRTAEGASMVVDLAAQAQDPALIQARMQTKLLQQIANGITGAASNYYNQPVAIVGEAMMG